MKRVVTFLVALALIGTPVWAMASAYAPTTSKPAITANNDTTMRWFQGAPASYDSATHVLTLTNGQKYIVAPNLNLDPLYKGEPIDGTYQVEHGKKVLESFWAETGQAQGASL